MVDKLPEMDLCLEMNIDEYERYLNIKDRRLYLTSEIKNSETESGGAYLSKANQLVDDILSYNRQDAKSKAKIRKPIKLYINSPGGELDETFSLISAIEISKTPVYTYNIGNWSSAAFLIGITGHKRYSMPNMRFLMHDGWSGDINSASKVQDKIKFDERFEKTVVKSHILKHGKMTSKQYDALVRVEYYMLPEDALKYGFIDEIVEDIDHIL